MPQQNVLSCRASGACLALLCLLICGCATTTPDVPPRAESSHLDHFVPPEFLPVVRYGRYTLVELAPQASQWGLLQQNVNLSIPDPVMATVGDALRAVLRLSGYRLCEAAPEAAELYALPLPAAHAQLGPMMLRDALLTLAGSAWELQVDEVLRQVCFTRAGTFHFDDAARPVAVP